jgi:hypothetical protein
MLRVETISKPKKFFFLIVGSVALFFGLIGLVIPVLPTTPLVLLSAWCFYRGSPKFHEWLVNHPRLGPIVDEYAGEDGISRDSKIRALVLMWISVLFTLFFILDGLRLRVFIISLALIGTFFVLKMKTRDKSHKFTPKTSYP